MSRLFMNFLVLSFILAAFDANASLPRPPAKATAGLENGGVTSVIDDLHLTEIAHPAEADPTCHQHEEKDPRIDKIANANKFPGESSGWRDSDSQLHHSHNNAPGNSDFHLLHGPEKEPQFFDTVDENVQSDHQADKDAILHSIKCYLAGDQLSDQDREKLGLWKIELEQEKIVAEYKSNLERISLIIILNTLL
ncbi:hypothetical protein PCASD_24961 [Puccinia coronata f. sp. avenae]|uniref:Secreted protein n=1 Tax=Puccinia coronata f. sp. avenae TaxID=200324 RepID=A0A2N5RZM3_9BASI|nr:hypothetical protein PCASD_24961 [Puccinia coronata f. sp. avenae]